MSPRTLPTLLRIASASYSREWTSHRLNRFLHAHLVLSLVSGCLVAFTPSAAGGSTWWILYAVLYAVSLSALLIGFSSAQAETDEFVWLLGQPSGIAPWLAGKTAALISLVGGSCLFLGLPSWIAGTPDGNLPIALAGAAAVTVVCALLGLTIGFWIRDGVRGLIASIAAWLLLLFGTDLLLLGLAGAPFVHSRPELWVAPLMLNPLDTFRVTMLFRVEHTAFDSMNAVSLAGWWAGHAALWMTVLTLGWIGGTVALSWLGARRQIDG